MSGWGMFKVDRNELGRILNVWWWIVNSLEDGSNARSR